MDLGSELWSGAFRSKRKRSDKAALGKIDLERIFALRERILEGFCCGPVEGGGIHGWPSNARSASSERQGFVPTPPSATRANRIRPFSVANWTAADARATS
jgi:hypothetical protein